MSDLQKSLTQLALNPAYHDLFTILKVRSPGYPLPSEDNKDAAQNELTSLFFLLPFLLRLGTVYLYTCGLLLTLLA